MNFSIKTFTFLLWAGVLMAGCGATKHQAMLDTIDSPQTRPATVAALQEDFKLAEAAQTHLIATARYLKAEKTFDEAMKLRSNSASDKKINHKLNQTRTELDSAMAFAKKHKESMSPLLEARQITLGFLSPKTTPNKDIKNVERKYLRLVEDLDSRQLQRVISSNRIPELTNEYQTLTIRSLKAKYLGEAYTNLEQAKKENAEKFVPKTFKDTKVTIDNASKYIADNAKPQFVANIQKRSNQATKASRRLIELTKQTKISESLSPEDQSLKTEALATAAEIESVRLQDKIEGSEGRVSDLEDKTEDYAKLEKINEKNKNFERVRQVFSEEEAKVYRQGDNLVISLKQINFAVNKSDIPSSSFGLLKKVQTAIARFEDPSVLIQGHTDSTGSMALNKSLSEDRALAVKSYFLSNSVVPAEKLASVGYGSELPLASNATRPGRAMNRRIDIVITE